MIYEIPYNKNFYNEFEKYILNLRGATLNFDEDCFVYFHYGNISSKYINEEYPDFLTSYEFVKDLEKRFNVNINWIDLSFIFDHLILKPDAEDLLVILYHFRKMYMKAIEKSLLLKK